MSNRVVIIKQCDYEPSSLKMAILRTLEGLRFDISRTAKKNVLLKPNLLGAYPPESGIITHPAFVAAAAEVFIEAGARVSIGDSPNGVFEPDECWQISGFKEVCKRTGALEVHLEAGGSAEVGGMMLAKSALEADFLINLPKFKTHSLTVMTLAVKNMFGCVNGMLKSRHHRENPDRKDFARMLVGVAERMMPALSIIDGIEAMEGNGPGAGRITRLGRIIAGTNVHFVDAACCRLIGLDPLEVDTLRAAKEMKLWNESEPLNLVGDIGDGVPVKKFLLPLTYMTGSRDWGISRFVLGRIWSNLSSRPLIVDRKCKRCLLCVEACPVNAISDMSKSGPPKIDRKRCIECLCCHEICPHKAIDIRQSLLLKAGRLLHRIRVRRKL